MRIFSRYLVFKFFISFSIFFSINIAQAQDCPVMTGALIDACATNMPVPNTGGGSEGNNEILAFRTGSTDVSVANLVNALSYYSTTQPMPPEMPSVGQNFTDSYAANTPYVDALNMIANCGQSLFIDAFTANTIPSHSIFWIMQGITMTHPGPGYPFDFAFLCNNGPIYLLFSTDNSWSNSGNFANSSATNPDMARYFLTDFTGVDLNCNQVVYDYFPDQLTNDSMSDPNGASVQFPESGGSANVYFNDGCTPRTLFSPPATMGDNAICQTDGTTTQPMEFETTFCTDGEACTQDLCTVDLQDLPFSPGLCTNPPITTCEPNGDGCCPTNCNGPEVGESCFNPDGSAIPGCDEDCSAMGPLPICGDGSAQPNNGEECDSNDAASCASGFCNNDCTCQVVGNVYLEGSGILSCSFHSNLPDQNRVPKSMVFGFGLVLAFIIFNLRRRLNNL